MTDTNNANTKSKSKNNYVGWIIAIIIVLVITLPFHYIPSRGMIFPKNELSFSHTIITESYIDDLIERYNNASFFERQAINQEPLVRKLMEKEVIIEEQD
ncbi:MAG: hypothetical protein ACQES1_02020 [Bacteroidota bacterium]